MKKLLGVFAHSGDESIFSGGTLSKYAKAGWQVDLVCGTRDTPKEHRAPLMTEEGISYNKQRELDISARELGVRTVTFFDYKENTLFVEPPGELENKLMTIFRDLRPDIVITIEPSGITNHSDGIKLSLSTTYAFQSYAADRRAANADDDNPPKLYYASYPHSTVSYLQKQHVLPVELSGNPFYGVDDKRITTVINISKFAASKKRAVQVHSSRQFDVDEFLDIPHNPFLSQEFYILRYLGLTEVFLGKNDRVSDRL